MIRALVIALLLANVAHADKHAANIAVAIGVTKGSTPSPQPQPTPTPPAPKPSGICDNCDGTGRLGDGTVSVPCPECGGDGRIESFGAAGIEWVSDQAAKASPKDNWYFVTDPLACSWCRKAKLLHTSPEVIAASRNFDCVLIDRSKVSRAMYRDWSRWYGVSGIPCDLIVDDGGALRSKFEGYAGGPAEYAARLNNARRSYGQAHGPIIDGGQPVISGDDFICSDGVCYPAGGSVLRPAPRLRLFQGGACANCR